MKTDFASLKKEFLRLSSSIPTDVEQLKKELNRLAAEVRGFDFSAALPSAQRERLEKRYRELRQTLTDLQKRLDHSFERVSKFVRKSSGKKVSVTKKSSRKTAGSTTTRKKVAKKVRRAKSSKA